MSFLSSMDIAGSGLTASRLRMDLISENLANASTTRTEDGGPYRRKVAVYESIGSNSFQQMLSEKSGGAYRGGVRVSAIQEDQSDFKRVYNPTHPDADADGYVLMPNVDETQETLDMMGASREYMYDLSAVNAVKQMATKALEIGK